MEAPLREIQVGMTLHDPDSEGVYLILEHVLEKTAWRCLVLSADEFWTQETPGAVVDIAESWLLDHAWPV